MASGEWFEVTEFPGRIIKISEPGHRHRLNSYLVEGERDVAVIDVGMGFSDFHGLASRISDKDPIVLLTHAHWDHVGDAWRYERILVHPAEADDLRNGTSNRQLRRWFDERHLFGVELPPETDPETRCIPGAEPTGFLGEGDVIDLGNREIEVFYTPGHSVGGVSFLDRGTRSLFTGDAACAGVVLVNFSGTDPGAYRETLRKLASLAPEIDAVYPSHLSAPVDPDLLPRMHQAYEQIWKGEIQPTGRREGTDIFRFDDFGFFLTPGTYGERR